MVDKWKIKIIETQNVGIENASESSVPDEATLLNENLELEKDGDAPFPVIGFEPLDGGESLRRHSNAMDLIIGSADKVFFHQEDAQSCFSHSIVHALQVIALLENKGSKIRLPRPRVLHDSLPVEYKDPVTGMVTAERSNALAFMIKKIKELGGQNNLQFTVSSGFNSRNQILQEMKKGNVGIFIIPDKSHAVVALKATDDGMLVCIDSLNPKLIEIYDLSRISPGTAIILSPQGNISRKFPRRTKRGGIEVIESVQL